MFQHLLVPTDGSELSDRVVHKAVEFSRETGAGITFLFVQPNLESLLFGDAALLHTLAPSLLPDAVKRQTEEIMEKAAKIAEAGGVRHACASVVAEEPYSGIICAAQTRGCDAIFMASHGRRGVQGLLIGSQTLKVLTHSKLPVLVFR